MDSSETLRGSRFHPWCVTFVVWAQGLKTGGQSLADKREGPQQEGPEPSDCDSVHSSYGPLERRSSALMVYLDSPMLYQY